MDSFLFVGQSNMSGRGNFSEVEPINNEGLFVFSMALWKPLYTPVNKDRADTGVCLAESFARRYNDEYKRPVGLIPCAEGNTALQSWQKGEILFDHAVMMVRLAMRSSDIKGILWHQGEADCNREQSSTYEERLVRVMTDMRESIGLPDVPVIMGELGEFLSEVSENHRQYISVVNEAVNNAAKRLGNSAVASAHGLTSNSDMVHFNAGSLRVFGDRYFEAYKTVK